MRHLQKPQLPIEDILEDCTASYRQGTRDGIKEKLRSSIGVICDESRIYDNEAEQQNWSVFRPHAMVNGILSKDDMCDVYDSKFVKEEKIKNKYYDHLMSLAKSGKCPICGIGQVSTLDHYLAKTIYPTYAVTPYNLVPVCKDCNFAKHDSPLDPTCAPLHAYYDEVDSVIWLKASLSKSTGGLVAEFSVCDNLREHNPDLCRRLKKHMELYELNKAYAVQATTEIAENILFWRDKLEVWGREGLKEHLSEVLASKEVYQRNTWNTALLRALIEDIEMVNDN